MVGRGEMLTVVVVQTRKMRKQSNVMKTYTQWKGYTGWWEWWVGVGYGPVGARASLGSLTADWIGWMDGLSMGWMERCCFSFALQERRSWWTVDGLCDDPLRTRLSDRRSATTPLGNPPLSASLLYIRSRGEEFTSDSFLFSFNFILSQSIGPFRLPTAPALSVVSLEVDMSQQERSQPFRIMTLVGYYTKLQRRDGDFVPPSTGTD
jgi:hypothetical protein